jgi:hypothetical protein
MDANAVTELTHAAAAATPVARLIYLNLAKRFRALFSYLVFLAVINLGYGLLDRASALYFWSYMVLEPLECVFGVFAVRELFALAFHDYPGIRTIGRWAMYAGLALALAVSLGLTGFFWNSQTSGRAHSHLFYVEVTKRSVVFTLAIVIVTILLSLSKYPLGLSRNTLVSSVVFSVLFLSEACRLLIDSLMPRLFNLYVDWTQSVFVSICLIGWAALLKPEVERDPAQVRFSRPEEDHLLRQLNSLNHVMTRAARR